MKQFLFLLLASIVMHNGCKSISPDLPMGDINVVVLTDVHSWVGGHGRHDSELDADYGDVLSFWERLKAHCDDNGKDLWLVNNGDFVHGTGISATGDPSSLIPVLEKMPWDAINCGNHELYDEAVVEYMTSARADGVRGCCALLERLQATRPPGNGLLRRYEADLDLCASVWPQELSTVGFKVERAPARA